MLLFVAVAANLAALAYFKYADFFLRTAADLTGADIPLLGVVLPLGISFFTFTQIAYLVDVHAGKVIERNPDPLRAVRHLLPAPDRRTRTASRGNDAAVPARRDLPAVPAQFHHRSHLPAAWDWRRKCWSPTASRRSPTSVFGAGPEVPLAASAAWLGVIAYTLQIYFDFSGYSDMAVGLSLLFGVRLPYNFNSPYQAWNITEFWRRWHMTLSRFLRDYLYVPLGGNRHGRGAPLRQSHADHAARRTVARRLLDVRHLGRAARRLSGGESRLAMAEARSQGGAVAMAPASWAGTRAPASP